MYRLPHATRYTILKQHHGEPETGTSLSWLNGKDGFVVAPFAASAECPILLLHPDEEATLDMPDHVAPPVDIQTDITTKDERQRYADNFARFHEPLTAGHYRKLVLARAHRLTIVATGHETLAEDTLTALFLYACTCYPHQYVALFSTPLSGTWLVATPEVLVEGTGNTYTTMALAGTMPVQAGARESDTAWSSKNREEQHIVEDYVEQCIGRFADTYEKRPCHTIHAGRLAHLCTDFRFTLQHPQQTGSLLEALHPTPAVCGLPKEAARRFIERNETAPRRYYSGFTGPLAPGSQTHLFVTLRCMNIGDDTCTLYAGGGLLAESTEQREWDETEAKMGTMRHVLRQHH